jgi:hypothetical protein
MDHHFPPPAASTRLPEPTQRDPLGAEQQARRAAAVRSVIVTTGLLRRSDATRARLLFGIRRLVVKRRRSRRRRVMGAAALAAVLVVVSFGQAIRHRWRRFPAPPELAWSKVDLAGVGRLRFSEGAHFSLRGEACASPTPPVSSSEATGPAVVLEEGEICAQIYHRDPSGREPFAVRTPQLRVRDVGTMFCVTARSDVSAVKVTEGEVWVETTANGPELKLSAGDFVRSDDPVFTTRPTPPPVEPADRPEVRRRNPVVRSCVDLPSVDERRACYLELSRGHGFGAQNALYSLALLDVDPPGNRGVALQELRLYQSRYPNGHLGPEVSLALIKLLSIEGPNIPLIDEASRFLSAYPEHPRFSEVAVLRANALARVGHRAEAHGSYRALLNGSAPMDIESAAHRGASTTALPPPTTLENKGPR